MVPDRRAPGVAVDHRCRGGGRGVQVGAAAAVGQVDDDAQPVEPPHVVHARVGEAVVAPVVALRAKPVGVVEDLRLPESEAVVDLQVAQIVLDPGRRTSRAPHEAVLAGMLGVHHVAGVPELDQVIAQRVEHGGGARHRAQRDHRVVDQPGVALGPPGTEHVAVIVGQRDPGAAPRFQVLGARPIVVDDVAVGHLLEMQLHVLRVRAFADQLAGERAHRARPRPGAAGHGIADDGVAVDAQAPLDVGFAGAQLVERGCPGAVDGFMHRGHSARACGG